MYIVQPGSATVKTNGVMVSPATTRAARCWPTTGSVTATGTSTLPSPGSAAASPGQTVAVDAHGLRAPPV